jgi:hypothetical protein
MKLVPHGTIGMAQAGMLSVDGRCKTFDARANGYVRGEGVGAVMLGAGNTAVGALVGGCAICCGGCSVIHVLLFLCNIYLLQPDEQLVQEVRADYSYVRRDP